MGLGLRAGSAVVGVAGVRAGLQRGDLALVVLAGDYGPRTADKVLRLAQGRRVPVLLGPGAREMGHRLGRATVQAAGVRDPRLAAGMLRS